MSYAEELLIRIRSAYDSGGFNKLDADLSRAKRGHDQLASNSTKNTGTMKSNLNSVAASAKSFGSTVIGAFDGIGGAITGLIAGFGLMQMATTAWTGATQAQLNKMLLTKKYGAEMAESLVNNIGDIVAAVPGDDTFMNAFLSGVARVGDIKNVDTLKNVAYIASDYMNASLAAGKMGYEIQQDLTKYILYGNTAELERGSILSSQIDSLKNKATIEERVLAMNEAMKKLGLDGLSQLDSASNMWEEVKGNIQLILSEFGTALLPYIQAAFDWFLNINESTDGWAARLVVISGIIIALVPVLGMLAGPFSVGITLIGSMAGAFGGLKTTILGTAAAEKVLVSTITPAEAAMGKLNAGTNQAAAGTSSFAKSTAIATIGIAAMVLALIGLTYYISQNVSATKAWNEVEAQRKKQVEAFKSTEEFLNKKLTEQKEIRTQLNATGQDTIQINRDIADTEAAIKSNIQAAADAKERYNRAVQDKGALETLGESRRNQATSEYTKYAEQIAQQGGQAPSTIMDPDYQAAVTRIAAKENKLSAVRLIAAGTMKRIAEGNDAYSKYWKTHGEEFGEYAKQYNEYIDSSEKFTEALDQGDIGGTLWYSIIASIDQADVGLYEIRASFQSWMSELGTNWDNFWKGNKDAVTKSAEEGSAAVQKPFQQAYLWLVNSWNGLPAWFGGLGTRLGELWNELVYYLVEKWNYVSSVVSQWINSGVNVSTGAIDWAESKYNEARAIISQWISTGVSVGTSAIDKATEIWNRFKNNVIAGVSGFVDIVFGGAGSPTEIDYEYQNSPYYEPNYTPITTSTVNNMAPVSSTSNKTIIAPVFNIKSINSREEADYVIHKVTKGLSDLNDSKGR